MRRLLSRAALLLLMMLTATTAWADNANYIDADGSSKSHDATALAGSNAAWTGWYVASGAVDISDRVVVTGEVYLILADGATLTIPKGITVTEGNSLTIYGQALGTGSLTIASPESGFAGIGGYVTNSSSHTAANTGSITINGGTINVTGSSVTAGGAAIGGVYWGNTGSITINGGSVTATGNRYGAGIGCGASASGGGTITITGGTVVATSAAGAGIGGATQAVTPDIYISGGNVTSESIGGTGAAGIGGGPTRSANIITISGGTVNATGGGKAAGIGGGCGGNGTPPGNCGTVTITGGTVTAIGGEGGAGIGSGGAYNASYSGANGGTIIITGGNVTARTTYNSYYGGGYGIGHGYAGNSTGLTADIRLSYTAASNSINAEGYTGAVTITDNKTMTDGTNTYTGVLTSDEITAIAGKTLYPYIETLALAANAHDGNFWTTFYCGHTGYRIDDGENATAYTAEYDSENSQLTLHKLGKVIPKQTAVILIGDDNSISMTASTDAAENTVGNDLHGVDVRTACDDISTTGTFYVMGKQGDDFGFFEYTADYMPARKAYVRIDGGAALAKALTMVFGDEETGITATTLTDGTKADDAWYTLDGRRLNGKPTKSGVYVNNGKKVVIK